jgi:hypothetical protein
MRNAITLLVLLSAMFQLAFAQEKRSLDQPVRGEFSMKFSISDPTGTLINEQVVLSKIVEELKARTKLRPTSERKNTGIPSQIYRGLARVEWMKDEPLLVLAYQALETTQEGSKYGQTLGVRSHFRIDRTPTDVTVVLQPDTTADLWEKKHTFFGVDVATPAIDTQAVFDDFQQLMDGAKSIELKMSASVKGEIESKYPVDAVLANFERKYPAFSGDRPSSVPGEMKKERVVTMTLANQRVPLRVTGFPYHEGTKISYSVSAPYLLSADGSTKGFELTEKIRAEVAAVVND